MSSHTPSPRLSRDVIAALTVCWVLFFALGFFGHLQLGNAPGDSAYKSLQLFHLHYHPYPGAHAPATPVAPVPGVPASAASAASAAGSGHHALPIAIEIARFGAGLWGLAIVPMLIGLVFSERITRWWVGWRWTSHHIVCGSCGRTMALVRDLRRDPRNKVVFIGICPESGQALPPGVVAFEGDSADPALLRRAAVHRASRLVAMHESDRANLETLVAAGRVCAGRPAAMPVLDAYAHIGDAHLQSGLYPLVAAAAGAAGRRIREHYFNYYELAARLLARRFPLPPAMADARPSPEHVVIVGFGAFGQNVALKLCKMTQQLHRATGGGATEWHVCRPRITVVDPRGEVAVAPFLRSYPNFREHCDFNLVTCSCEHTEFLELAFLESEGARHTTIVFCLENEIVTLRTLSLILEVCRSAEKNVGRIYMRLAQPERLGALIDQLQQNRRGPEIVFFAPDSAIFNADAMLDRSLDVLARAVHEAWLAVEGADRRANNLPPAAGKTWEELSEDDRQGNREAADHTWAKLRLLGYELEEVPAGETPAPDPGLLQELSAREEELAYVEHYRWMTMRVLNGWRHGSPRDNARLIHPDIVAYEQLAKSTKEKDRIVIRAIPELLRRGRLRARRTPPPA